MSAHASLNLLDALWKKINCKACQAFYCFFTLRLINSIIKKHEYLILFIIWHQKFFEITFLACKF